MLNVEKYKNEIAELLSTKCTGESNCKECPFDNFCSRIGGSSNQIEKWLFEECKEPIKLTQFEYDIINYHGRLSKFNDICFLMAMKNKGHFKHMDSVEKCSMTIEEILENCEVVE